MPTHPSTPWLTRYAAFTALATLGLVGLGGLVTSHGAGMAVPDWPTTYGYNMFLFPVSQWVGGVFYEHTHRLWASGVGLLTVVLAVALQWRCRAADPRLVRWGWFAVGLVIVQGVLGGLRVSLMKDQIGVLHAGLAQAFLVLLTLIALRTSATWARWQQEAPRLAPALPRAAFWVSLGIFLQLILGATMRHQHAGLAVPDFPLAYGSIWPPTDEAFLSRVNALRTDVRDFHPITAFQIYVHMAHRLGAILLTVAVLGLGVQIRKAAGRGTFAGKLALAWQAAILAQVALGAVTVWSNKAADIATAHVVAGAVCLALGATATAACRAAARRPVAQDRTRPAQTLIATSGAAMLGTNG